MLLVLVLFVGIFIGTSGTDAPINPPADSALEERESEEGAEQASGSADTFTRDNYAGLVADPAAHEGAAVEITGQLLGSPEANGGETAFQMYADPANSEWNTVVYYEDPELALEADAYVRVRGTVMGSIEGENAFGASLTAPQVQADSVEITDAAAALDPTVTELETNQTQGDQGFSVTLLKVEFGRDTTRAYVSLQNGTGATASLYPFNAKILQGSTQVDPTDSFEYAELEPQTDLSPGVQSEGVITFGPVNPDQPFDVQFEWSSENYDITTNPINFSATP